jgi:2-oxoisovalerate ferredoxin oxidoreductase beta subunit
MTGGQLAPTTLVGQASTTSPWGRRPTNEGMPMKVSELLSSLEAPVYIERVALNNAKNILSARKAVRKALELQKQQAGFTLVEILSPCPTIWKKDAVKARQFVEEKMIPAFPLGVYRDRKAELPAVQDPPQRTVAEVLGIKKENDGRTHIDKTAARHQTHPLTAKVAGFGGQGVLLLGQLIAEMGMRERMEVSWLPSYGPEMRSGSAHCHVCLAHDRIGSPLVSRPDVLIAMNEFSLRKFGPQVAQCGLVLYNAHEVPPDFSLPQARVICLPAAEIADVLGSAKVTNIVMLGAMLEDTAALPREAAVAVLKATVKNPQMLDLDLKALDAGADYIAKHVRIGAVSQPDGFAY